MSPLMPLLAQGNDLGTIIGFVLVFLFMVIPFIGQLVAKKLNLPNPPGGGPRPAGHPGQPPAQRPAQPPGQPPVRQPADQAIDDEIGDFLRRAAHRAGGRQQPAAPPPPPPPPQPAMAEVVPEVPLGDAIRQEVAGHLDADKFDRSASELGDAVTQTDTLFDRHLHDVFDHDVSRLSSMPGKSARTPLAEEPIEPEFPSTAAAGLPALLSNAASIRQAIIINEILQRPEHRWT